MPMPMSRKIKSLMGNLKAGLNAPLQLVAILIGAFAITLILPDAMRLKMGVTPRSVDGLLGILLHPLLHFGAWHLMCNATAILIFGWLISLRSKEDFIAVTAAAWLMGGVLLWLVGKSATTVGGASGIVYGLLGFILLRGVFDKSFVSICVSILTLYFFHGVLMGMLPTRYLISSHCFMSVYTLSPPRTAWLG
jgi:membrane associated rhomboid family serine protease